MVSLVFNVYLVYTLYQNIEPDSVNLKMVEENVEVMLDDRNISHPPLSKSVETIPFVKVGHTHVLEELINQLEKQVVEMDAEGRLVSTFDQPLDLGLDISESSREIFPDDRNKLKTQLLDHSGLILFGDKYPIMTYNSADKAIVLRMELKSDHPVVDGTGEIRILLDDAHRIIGYTQTYLDTTSFYELEMPKRIISEQEAFSILDRRSETMIPQDSEVLTVKLGYFNSMSLKDFDVYSPAWLISYRRADGRVKVVLVDAVRSRTVPRVYE